VKKIFFILLLFPTQLFAQKDSARQTFKIGGCKTYLSECYSNDAVGALSVIMKKPIVTIRGCGDSAHVISFTIDFQANSVFYERTATGNILTQEVLNLINRPNSDQYIIIRNVRYLSGHDTLSAGGIAVHIVK